MTSVSHHAPCSKFHKKVRKVTSLLVELKKKAAAGLEGRSDVWVSNLRATVTNCLREATAIGLDAHLDCTSSENLLASCVECETLLFLAAEEHDSQNKRELLQSWKLKLRRSSSGTKRHVHRWLKGERVGSPKIFLRPDGSFTADVNEMLGMISEFMGKVYNFHHDACPDQMEQQFYDKYRTTVDSMASPASVPVICHHELFRLLQSKSPEKASGLDGWRVAELHHLPPSGWIGFAFTMRLAEATHVWPKALKVVSISSISKGLSMTSPENVRCGSRGLFTLVVFEV